MNTKEFLQLRQEELNLLVLLNENNLCSDDVIKKSRELDKIILKLQKSVHTKNY